MITSYVYRHTNIDNTFYIGYREANVRAGIRPEDDLPKYICSSPKIRNNIKENRDGWVSEIICCFYEPTDAYDFEQKLILENWNNILLLNKQCIVEGKKRFRSIGQKSEAHRLKISKGLTGRTRSPSHCAALSKANTGKKCSEESIKKRVLAVTGTKRSSEQCKRISNSLMNHTVSDETRKKISVANSGRSQPSGKDSPCSKSIVSVTTNQVFGSQPEAAAYFGIRQGDINNVLKGRQKTVKGLQFEYQSSPMPTGFMPSKPQSVRPSSYAQL